MMRFFDLIGPLGVPATGATVSATGAADVNTAFGIFFRCQVTHFDLLGLFLLSHFILFLFVYFGLSVVCLASVTPKGN
jgi:hypothetical protein